MGKSADKEMLAGARWNRDEPRMSEEESKRLTEAIGGNPPEPAAKGVKMQGRVNGTQRIRKTAVILLDLTKYRTDSGEDETDWDER
jgi:hypothetical protein